MKVLILTTSVYERFLNSGNWDQLECENVREFLQSINSRHLLGNELVMLKRAQRGSYFYVMPCVPKESREDSMDSFYELKNRQDYIGCIIEDVLKDICVTSSPNVEIWLVAHDRDFIDEMKERPLSMNDLQDKSKILSMINNNIINIGNIYIFQHDIVEPRSWRVYSVINDYLAQSNLNDLNIDIMELFIRKIRNRASEFQC